MGWVAVAGTSTQARSARTAACGAGRGGLWSRPRRSRPLRQVSAPWPCHGARGRPQRHPGTAVSAPSAVGRHWQVGAAVTAPSAVGRHRQAGAAVFPRSSHPSLSSTSHLRLPPRASLLFAAGRHRGSPPPPVFPPGRRAGLRTAVLTFSPAHPALDRRCTPDPALDRR